MILCSGTLGDVPFPVKARAAAAAGFTGISIYSREFEPGLRPLLDDLGLRVAEVDGAMRWRPGEERGPEPERVLDIATELGARSMTVLETTGVAPDLGAAADAFATLCDAAFGLGVLVHIEPFAWSGIDTVAGAAAIVRRAARPNGGVLLDTWHVARGPESGLVDLGPVDLVMAIQVSDPAPVAELDVATECRHRRELPGSSAAAMVAVLRGAGCDAPIEVEVFSDVLRALDPVNAARLAFEAYRRLP